MFGKKIKYILFTFFVSSSVIVFAQQDTSLSREVEVVKAYNPTITDANKISNMPKIEDEEHEKPSFDYSIFSQPIYNTFSVNELKAASFVPETKEDPGFGLVRAGVGNYYKPYGEVFFNSQKMRNTIFGLHGKHLSSHGKITLEGDDRVDAPFSENEAEMFIKHLYRSSVLSVNLGFNHDGFNYYGYPVDPIPDLLKEEDQEINLLGDRQTFSRASLDINLENVAARNNDLTFDFDFLYHYFGTKTGQRENFGEFIVDVEKPLDTGTGALEAGITFVQADEIFNRNMMEMGKRQQVWLMAKPSYLLGGDVANIRFGINGWFVFDNAADDLAKLAPVIRANFVPVKEIINIFAGVDGNYINNHYSKIAYENPFVDPLHDVKSTFERFRFYGGFDGKLAAKTNFKLAADYSMFTEKPYYYLFRYAHPSGVGGPITDNDFQVLYDNSNRLKLNLEIYHAAFDKVTLLLEGNYYIYEMESLDEAWNLPEWDAKLSMGYQASEQLSLSADLFLTGQRKALILEVPVADPRPLTNRDLILHDDLKKHSYPLPFIFDLNVNGTYKITERFSVFAQLNNFGFQNYQRWLGYPVQSFNVLGGLSYAF